MDISPSSLPVEANCVVLLSTLLTGAKAEATPTSMVVAMAIFMVLKLSCFGKGFEVLRFSDRICELHSVNDEATNVV